MTAPTEVLSFASRYQVFTTQQAERAAGLSREAARSQARRLKKKGLLTASRAADNTSYWLTTVKARKLLGLVGRGPRSGGAVLTALAITEFFSHTQYDLLTPAELAVAFEHLRQTADLELDVPGLQRSRYFWRDGELSRVLVETTLPSGFDARRYLKRIQRKARALRLKSPGWRTLIDSGGTSFTVLSPVDRTLQLSAAAEAAEIVLHAHTVPLLAMAWGVRCEP